MGYNQDCRVQLRVPADKTESVVGIMREWLTERDYPLPDEVEEIVGEGFVILLGEGGDVELFDDTEEYIGDTYGKASYDDSAVLALLAAAGVTGIVDARGEDDVYWRWRLKDGELFTYSGEIHYPEDPDDTTRSAA